MQRPRSLQVASLAVSALMLGACESKPPAADTTTVADTPAATTVTATADSSLYSRLGGKDAITAVIDDFVANVAADKRINARFAKTDIAHLKRMLVEQVCEASGGPCTYTGKNMRAAHAGMKITEVEFNALVEDLTKSLDKFDVAEREKKELLSALGGMKGDIVGI